MTWKIQALTGELTQQAIVVDRDMLVGRHQDADIVLQSAEISRRHAALLLKEQALYLQDLNSSNGTFVNDERIAAETALHAGDTIRFASLAFTILEEQKLSTATPTPVVTETEQPVQPSEAVATSSHLTEQVVGEQHVETVSEPVVDQVAEAVVVDAVKPAVVEEAVVVEAVEPTAVSETAKTVVEEVPQVEPTPAQEMNTQGMPSVAERSSGTSVSKEGMPDHVAIPKPAPIPDNIVGEAAPEPVPVAIPTPVSVVKQAEEAKKNTSIGSITVIALVILAILAWLMFNK